MSDSALAALTAASTPDGSELIYGTQSGADRKFTTAQVASVASSVSGVNAQVGTSYTLLASDKAKLVTFNNAAAVAVTVPAAAGSFGANYYSTAQNIGAGTVTLTPASGTINGAASLALAQNQGVTLVSDGANWFAFTGRAVPAGGGTTPQNNFTATSNPTTGADSSIGYSAGSLWLNTSTGGMFICRSASVGAAVWVKMRASAVQAFAGDWYSGDFVAANGTLPGANTIKLHPIEITDRLTVSQLAVRCTTVGTTNVQMAIYRHDPTTNRPSALVDSTPSVANTATGDKIVSLNANQQLEPGIYWLASNSGDGAAVYCAVPAGGGVASKLGSVNTPAYVIGAGSQINGLSIAAKTFGTWPASLASETFTESTGNTMPAIAYKVASVP